LSSADKIRQGSYRRGSDVQGALFTGTRRPFPGCCKFIRLINLRRKMDNQKEKSVYTGFVHVGVVVRDMSKTIKRLESLGVGPFVPHGPPTPVIGEPDYRGKVSRSDDKILEAKMGDFGLVLFEPGKGENSPFQEFLDNKGEGIQHIALRVDDLDKEMANLKKQGVDTVGGLRWEGGGGFFYDPEIGGILIELFEE
jgi:methylmalonyl-CoA/ethylmalonyl-CoA epimerase